MSFAQKGIYNLLKQKDPQMADTLLNLMNSGQNPNIVLRQAIEAGKVSRNDINLIRQNRLLINRIANINITDNDLKKLESMFDNTSNNFRF
jgi:hypothetical protein